MWTYAPDLDERTPNILLSGSANVVPTNNGGMRPMYTAPNASGQTGQPSYPDVGATVFGARYLLGPSGADRLFCGTAKALFEANQAVTYSWTAVTRAAGSYSDTAQWSFDAYGANFLAIASLGTRDYPQFSNSETVGTVFANLTNAPKARIMVVQDNALYLFDYDNGTAYPDGWIRSDTGAITSWTPGTAECVSGSFTETVGPITAAIKQGNGVVVFKDRGMWRGQYVGLPEVVRWELITPSVGCIGPLAVVNVDDVLYFCDSQGFWRYDGSRPVNIGNGLNVEARQSLNANSINQGIQIGVDDASNIITFHFIGSGSVGAFYYPYNYKTGAWGSPCNNSGGAVLFTGLNVSAVCNGAFNKMHAMPGMSGVTTNPNNYWFAKSGTGLFRNFAGYVWNFGSGGYTVTTAIIPSYFGDDYKGRTITKIYHDYKSYSLSSTGTSTTTNSDTITSYRRPYSMGAAQGSVTSSGFSTALGYTSLTINGNWFKEARYMSGTLLGANDTLTISYEWLGFQPEYAPTTSRN